MRLISAALATVRLLTCFATPALAAATPATAFSTRLDAIAASIRDSGVPAITLLVAEGANVRYARAFGFSDLDHDVPATIDTVYGIGSLTKQFVAAAALRVVQSGRLSLDDPVEKYFPGFPAHGRRITLHHLLSNTSGLPEFGPLPGRNAQRLDYTRDELLKVFVDFYNDRDFPVAPGDKWEYESVNYSLLGMVIEKATGQNLWDYLRNEFFNPFGMNDTAQCNPSAVMKRRAQGYRRNSASPFGVEPGAFFSPTITVGASGLCSSAPDLLKWRRALVGHRVVRRDLYTRMITPARLNNGDFADYGYGLVIWEVAGEPVIFHTGGIPGYTSYLAYLPRRDTTVVVLMNANSDVFTIGSRVVRTVMALPDVADLKTTPDELARYAGTYESGHVRAVLQIAAGYLTADVTGTNSYRFLFAPRLLKQRDSEFAVEWEPQARLNFIGTGERSDSVVLSFGNQKIQLRRVRD